MEVSTPVPPVLKQYGRGTIIAGRYEVIGPVGVGGTGFVLKVHDLALNRRVVALKILHAELINEPTILARFQNEVIITQKLSHPNIVRVHDFGVGDGGFYFIIMEYAEGESLSKKMSPDRTKNLTFEQTLHVLWQLADALNYAHEQGIVHRDIKPDNIIVDQDWNIKVTDFGVARSLTLASGLTRTGEAIGTPVYMSPEQVNARDVDTRADIYTYGVLAYEMVVGAPPFMADNWLTLAAMHVSSRFPVEKLRKCGAPRWFVDLVVKATAKKPENRFQKAAEIRQVIETHQFGAKAGSPPSAGEELLIKVVFVLGAIGFVLAGVLIARLLPSLAGSLGFGL